MSLNVFQQHCGLGEFKEFLQKDQAVRANFEVTNVSSKICKIGRLGKKHCHPPFYIYCFKHRFCCILTDFKYKPLLHLLAELLVTLGRLLAYVSISLI